MRLAAALILTAVLSAAGTSAGGADEPGLAILQFTVREHLEPPPPFEGQDPTWLRFADLDLQGVLPRDFRLDPAAAPVRVELEVNGVGVWTAVSIRPKRRGRRWDAVPYHTPTSHMELPRWFRARLDLRTRRLRFRDRFLDHALMEGDPVAVPWRIRVGDQEFSGTIDFTVARPGLWRYRRPRPRTVLGR